MYRFVLLGSVCLLLQGCLGSVFLGRDTDVFGDKPHLRTVPEPSEKIPDAEVDRQVEDNNDDYLEALDDNQQLRQELLP
ncbi:MAG: hypothetical protein ACPGXY_01315 [Alphaproteobacteria bacterium]